MILGLSALLVASPNALLFLFLPFIGLAKGLETRVLSSPRGVWCHQPAELERAALLFFSCLWNEISRSWIHTISTQQKIQNIFSATRINAGQDNLFFSNAKCKHNPHYMIWSKHESHILPMKYKTRDHKVWDTYQYTWEWLYVAAHMGAPIPYCFICSVWPFNLQNLAKLNQTPVPKNSIRIKLPCGQQHRITSQYAYTFKCQIGMTALFLSVNVVIAVWIAMALATHLG